MPRRLARKVKMESHWLLPPDATEEEKEIMQYCVSSIYQQFDDPLDKFIIMAVFEMGYPNKFVANLIDRSEVTMSIRIKKIKTILSKTHKSLLKQ